jgi:2-dehydropantoate 2-reductase
VIGSVYAVKFAEAKMDVTLLARGARLETLRNKDLQYDDKGVTRSVKVRVIDSLDEDDIYDYILVPVRYDQIEGALGALQRNKSPNIVTMTTTSVGYDRWLQIVGHRLIPGFPCAGGTSETAFCMRKLPRVLSRRRFSARLADR